VNIIIIHGNIKQTLRNKTYYIVMKLKSSISTFIQNCKKIVGKLSILHKIIILIVIIAGIWFVKPYIIKSQTSEPQYETTTVEKGTLIASIAASGTITTGNTTSITTGATGTIKNVYAKNGDTVKKGDKIADLTLDDYGQKRLSAAWLSYINAQNASKTAVADKNTADIQMWQFRQDILDAEDAIKTKDLSEINPDTKEKYTLSERTVVDKNLDLARSNFAAAELKYKTADATIQNTNVRISSAWYDYQQVSSTITAPESGIIQNLVLAPGTVISNSSDSSISINDGTTSSNSSNNNNTLTASSQSVGTVRSVEGQFKATVNVTEIDIPSIQSAQKVTLTLDAFPDKSFTGNVLAVDTNGTVSSGVTSYPVTVLLDPTTIQIYPKMAVDANIITLVKNNVLLVPTTAIDTQNTTSTIQILKNGKASTVNIQIGNNNDSQTEITSGLSAGDTVITSTSTSTTASNSKTTSTSSTSIFGSMSGFRNGGPPGQ
jgi:membrane fusion protein, macrolide-specific efflux system